MLGSSTFKALAISPILIYGFGKLALTWKMKKEAKLWSANLWHVLYDYCSLLSC